LKKSEKRKEALDSFDSREQLEEARIKYLGKKGELTAILKQMASFPQRSAPLSASWQTKSAPILRKRLRRKPPSLRKRSLKESLRKKRLTLRCRQAARNRPQAPAYPSA
jgi:phenylalanyl-tRNA synthetase alpha chain